MREPNQHRQARALPRGGFDRGADPDLARLESAMGRALADPAAFSGTEALAEAAQVGLDQLKELFRDHAHQSPAAFLQRIRIDAACARLLKMPTGLSGLAFEAGYESASGFREAFQRQTGLSPGGYRTMLGSDHFTLPMPAGLRVRDVLAFQGRDGQSVSERVEGPRLQKAFLCEGQASVLSLTFGDQGIVVSLAGAGGGRAMARAHGAALSLLGWQGDPTGFEAAHPGGR
jgi:AraC family transcriptional regulator of adaptative response / DNA-3-methyladenine glycosylase II